MPRAELRFPKCVALVGEAADHFPEDLVSEQGRQPVNLHGDAVTAIQVITVTGIRLAARHGRGGNKDREDKDKPLHYQLSRSTWTADHFGRGIDDLLGESTLFIVR